MNYRVGMQLIIVMGPDNPDATLAAIFLLHIW